MVSVDPEAIKQMCQKSLGAFAVAMDPFYEIPPHVEISLQVAEKVERGDPEWDRIQVSMPPRHSKSETWSVKFPAWYLGKNPSHKIIMITHGQDLANRMGVKVRDQIVNPMFRHIFPDCELAEGAKAKRYFQTTKGGEFLATTVNGGATGFGAHLLIIDDPVKDAQDAKSPVVRQNVIEFYRSVAYTRLMPGGRIVIVMTRWSDGDLMGWLLDPHEQEEVEDWKQLVMPAIAEEDEGWRKEGEALWPEKFPLKTLRRIKKAKGSWDWAAQYQQRPSAIEGRDIKRAWFKNYSWNPSMAADRSIARILTQPFMIVQSWDTANKTEEQHDFSVCTTWLVTKSGYYLLHVWRKKVIITDLFTAAKELALYWQAHAVLVEDSSGARGFVQLLEVHTKLPIIKVNPKGDKESRVRATSPTIEAGRVFLPYQSDWQKEYLDELCGFPTAGHDDQTDSTSQFLQWITNKENQDEKYGELQEPDDPFDILDV